MPKCEYAIIKKGLIKDQVIAGFDRRKAKVLAKLAAHLRSLGLKGIPRAGQYVEVKREIAS